MVGYLGSSGLYLESQDRAESGVNENVVVNGPHVAFVFLNHVVFIYKYFMDYLEILYLELAKKNLNL